MSPTPLANSARSEAGNLASWDQFAAALSDSEFSSLAMICAIGLIMTLLVALAVPNFAETMVPLQPFL